MTKRQAKREACAIVARMIDNYLDVGGHVSNTRTEQDADRQQRAMESLRDELDRRTREEPKA